MPLQQKKRRTCDEGREVKGKFGLKFDVMMTEREQENTIPIPRAVVRSTLYTPAIVACLLHFIQDHKIAPLVHARSICLHDDLCPQKRMAILPEELAFACAFD